MIEGMYIIKCNSLPGLQPCPSRLALEVMSLSAARAHARQHGWKSNGLNMPGAASNDLCPLHVAQEARTVAGEALSAQLAAQQRSEQRQGAEEDPEAAGERTAAEDLSPYATPSVDLFRQPDELILCANCGKGVYIRPGTLPRADLEWAHINTGASLCINHDNSLGLQFATPAQDD